MQFGKVGPNAKAAVPYLRESAGDPQRQTWLPAARALLKIGETNLAVSELLKKVGERDFDSRFEATKLILEAQPTNATAMAALIRLMQDDFRGSLAMAVAVKMGAAAAPALPALRQIANNKRRAAYHSLARETIRDIESAAQTGLPSGDSSVRGTGN